jgi:hypothetical protein
MASPRDESTAAAAQSAQAHIASRGSVTASWSDQRGKLSMMQRQSSQDAASTPSPSPAAAVAVAATAASAAAAAPPPASAKVRAPPPPPSRPKAPPVYVPSEALSSVPIPAYMQEGIQLALQKQNSQEAAKTRRGCMLHGFVAFFPTSFQNSLFTCILVFLNFVSNFSPRSRL